MSDDDLRATRELRARLLNICTEHRPAIALIALREALVMAVAGSAPSAADAKRMLGDMIAFAEREIDIAFEDHPCDAPEPRKQ